MPPGPGPVGYRAVAARGQRPRPEGEPTPDRSALQCASIWGNAKVFFQKPHAPPYTLPSLFINGPMSDASCGPTSTSHPGMLSSSSPEMDATYPGMMTLRDVYCLSTSLLFRKAPIFSPLNFRAAHAVSTLMPSASTTASWTGTPAFSSSPLT